MMNKKTFIYILKKLIAAFDEWKRIYMFPALRFAHEKELQKAAIQLNRYVAFMENIMCDEFGVIREFIFERDNGEELFFGIPNLDGFEFYLITDPADLYDYLSEQMREQGVSVT